MSKLNYTINILPKNKKEEENKLHKSMNSLSKQSVINESLAYRMPQNVPINNNTRMVTSEGFGRSV